MLAVARLTAQPPRGVRSLLRCDLVLFSPTDAWDIGSNEEEAVITESIPQSGRHADKNEADICPRTSSRSHGVTTSGG